VFENRVLRVIFGSKREEFRRDWRNLHNEEHVARVIRTGQTEDCGEETWNKGPIARPWTKWESKIKINRKGKF
jgi:hypothetical protein